MELVEQLGSGIPRILKSYGEECFHFSENYIRISFPKENPSAEQVTEQVSKLISAIENEMSIKQLMEKIGIIHRPTFIYNYLKPAMDADMLEMTIPEKPKSSQQKYRLTSKGLLLKTRAGSRTI